MTSIDLNRAWAHFVSDSITFTLESAARSRALFVSDPAAFASLCAAVAVAVACLTWWLSRGVYKRRIAAQITEKDREIAAKRAQIQIALSQRDEVDARLTDAQASNSQLQRQIVANANDTELIATAKLSQAVLDEMKIATDKMGITLNSR